MTFNLKFSFLLVLLVSSPGRCNGETQARMNCAHGAVLAALTAHGFDVGADAVIAAFPENYRAADAVTPMSVVGDVIKKYGLAATPVRFDVTRASRNWESCILLLDADPKVAGHFVWLKSISDKDEAILVDPMSTIGEHVLSLQQLSAYWHGEAIVVRRGGIGSLSWYLTPLLVAIVVLLVLKSPKQIRKRPISAAMLILLASSIGCIEQNAHALPSVEFREKRVEISGIKEGATKQIRLILEILADQVEIAEIQTSCSCASVDRDLVGKSFSRGDTCEVVATVDPENKKELAFDIVVQTKNGDATRVNLAGIVEQAPRAVSPVIVSEYIEGVDKQLQGLVLIQRQKPRNAAILNRGSNSLHGKSVRLDYITTTEERIHHSRAGGDILLEQCKWEWAAIPIDGKFQDEQVVVSLGEYQIPIDFKFVQNSPLRGLPLSVYCGKLLPGQEWSREFKLVSTTEPHRYAVSSRIDNPKFKLDVGKVLADRSQKAILTMVAPDQVGKFSEFIELKIHGIEKPVKVEILGEVVKSMR